MAKRLVEVFVAGCGVCEPAVGLVEEMVCPDCEVAVRDVREEDAAARAEQLGVKVVPSVAVDGVLAGCCGSAGPKREELAVMGVGRPLA